MRTPARFCGLVAALATAVLPLSAGAADDAVHPQIRACVTLKNDSERLTCYDAAVAQLSSGARQAQAAPANAPEAMFGISGTRLRKNREGATDEREELAALTARVTALRADAHGMMLIELDNGQSWQQLGSASQLLLKPGDSVTISRAALNSFRLSTPAGRAAKVRRVL